MGKLHNGLRSWWQSVAESSFVTVKAFFRSSLRPPFTHSFMILETDEGLNILLGLIFGVLSSGAIAVGCGILIEFLIGIVSGGSLMMAWANNMERRSRKRSVIAGNVALLGINSTAIAGYQQVAWLNKVLKKVWPYIASATEISRPSIRDCLEPLLEEYRLGVYQVIREQADVQRVEKYIPGEEVITALHVNDISLGKIAPTIQGLKILELKEGKIVCKLRVDWQSDARITLGVGTVAGTVPIIVENMNMITTIQVILRIIETPPFVAGIVGTIPARSKSTAGFTLSVVETPMTVLPVVTKRLRRFVNNFVLDNFLWPCRLVLPVIPPTKDFDLQDLYLRPHGQLSVGILHGDNLVNLYPYVTIYCRPLLKLRTKSVENTRDPIWNEEFILDVEDKETQSLILQVMNENKGPDEHVSTVSYPLKDLPLDQDMELKLDVRPRKHYENGVDGQIKKFGSLSVELRYHVYTDLERETAMRAKEELTKALATPDEQGSYSIAMDLIHP